MANTQPDAPGAERQMGIYLAGTRGQKPARPLAVEELERRAKEVMRPEAYDYVAGGAGSEDTVRANRDGFRRWRLVPRLLRNVEQRDLSVTVMGQRLRAPLFFAPVGVQEIIHPEAEVAVARAARSLALPLVLSTLSSKTLEEVARAMGDVPRWFQLYWPKNPDLAISFLQRAEKAGYAAIVVTLDTYLLGWRERDLQRAHLPFIKGEGLANYFTDPVFRSALKAPPEKDPAAAVLLVLQIVSNPALTWQDLAFLRRHTKLPIVLKGILDPDDARKAVDHGIEGVIVSNHGGRQLDGAIAAIDALPRVAAAVGNRTTVLFDSGIRRGPDVLKAMALGARAVLVGRAWAWAVAARGERGVRHVLRVMQSDIDVALGLTGQTSIAGIDRSALYTPVPAP